MMDVLNWMIEKRSKSKRMIFSLNFLNTHNYYYYVTIIKGKKSIEIKSFVIMCSKNRMEKAFTSLHRSIDRFDLCVRHLILIANLLFTVAQHGSPKGTSLIHLQI